MSLVVVIPTHNRNELLQRTLTSLAACRLPTSYTRTIVVENGGKFGAENVVREAASALRCEYLHCERGNKSAALNTLLEQVDDDLLVFFDDDVRIAEETVAAYEAVSGETEAFFGGPFDVDYEVEPAPWVQLPQSASRQRAREPLPNGFLGFNWAARAADLRRCGGFDPRLGPGGESGGRGQESDMQRRLHAAGLRPVFVKEAMVWHYVPRDRCSEAWSLERAYQVGVTVGLGMDDSTVKHLCGYPRWMLPLAARKGMRALVASVVRRHESRYKAWHEYYTFRGHMDGARFAHRQAPQPAGHGTFPAELRG